MKDVVLNAAQPLPDDRPTSDPRIIAYADTIEFIEEFRGRPMPEELEIAIFRFFMALDPVSRTDIRP